AARGAAEALGWGVRTGCVLANQAAPARRQTDAGTSMTGPENNPEYPSPCTARLHTPNPAAAASAAVAVGRIPIHRASGSPAPKLVSMIAPACHTPPSRAATRQMRVSDATGTAAPPAASASRQR